MNKEMNLFHGSVVKVGHADNVFKILVPVLVQFDIGIVFCGGQALDSVQGKVPNLVLMVLLHAKDVPSVIVLFEVLVMEQQIHRLFVERLVADFQHIIILYRVE